MPAADKIRCAVGGALCCIVLLCGFLLAGCSSESARSAAPLTPEQQHGERLFLSACARCHESDSTKPRNGPGLAGMFRKPYLPSGAPANDERVRDVMTHGRRNMPPFNEILDDQQMNDLLAYMHTL